WVRTAGPIPPLDRTTLTGSPGRWKKSRRRCGVTESRLCRRVSHVVQTETTNDARAMTAAEMAVTSLALINQTSRRASTRGSAPRLPGPLSKSRRAAPAGTRDPLLAGQQVPDLFPDVLPQRRRVADVDVMHPPPLVDHDQGREPLHAELLRLALGL